MKLFLNNTKKSGFTLIELLVVISIIGLLSSVVLASLASARRKAQGAAMGQSISQLRTAVEMYLISNPTAPAENTLLYDSSASFNDYNGNTRGRNTYDDVPFDSLEYVMKPIINGGYIKTLPTPTSWPHNDDIYFQYESYPASISGLPYDESQPGHNGEYYACGTTKWGRYTLSIAWYGISNFNRDIVQAAKLPKVHKYYVGDDGSTYPDWDIESQEWYCITSS
jgi:prepilin-type N-terminal cleavage/methylation domain-containing protein